MAIDPARVLRALHARPERAARPLAWTRPRAAARNAARLIAALAMAGALAAGPGPAAADGPPFTSGYPHLFYDDTGWLDGRLDVIARFDALSTAFWNGEGETAVRLDSLATMNPDLIRLAYVNIAGWSLPDVADPQHVVNRLDNSIAEAWLVRNEFGDLVYWDPRIPNMPLLNLSTRCPRVNGKTWGEFIADFMVSDMLSSGRWDGFMMDNIWNGAAWVNAMIPGSLDLDRNGLADPPDSVDVWWNGGVNQMLSRFRTQAGPGVLAIGNGNGRQFATLNGRHFEDFPLREGWAGSLQQIADWQTYGRPPVLVAGVTRSTASDFRRMRYGLCTGLMANIFTFHYAEEHSWPNPVFYDEYAVDLGQPLGDAIELGIDVVAEADFDTGLPATFPGTCGAGEVVWTTDPNLVISGAGAVLGRFGNGPGSWHLFLCSSPEDLPLAPNATYTVSFEYRVVSEPPGNDYFYLGARSDVNLNASNRNLLILDPPAGAVGEARADVTLGPYPDYYLYFGMLNGGSIVIDSIRIVSGRGGVFRRDFDKGIALVNPTLAPMTMDLESGLFRIDGVIDPVTNDGSLATRVTLPAQDGLVLLRGPSGVEQPPGGVPETPPVMAGVFSFPNPVDLTTGQRVTIAGVPPGGSIAIIAPSGRVIRRLSATGGTGDASWDLCGPAGRQVPAGIYTAAVRDAENRPAGAARLVLKH